MTYFPNQVSFGDNYAIDSKARLRVVNATNKYLSDFRYTSGTVDWHTVTVGTASSGSHLPNEAAVGLCCGPNVGDMCTRQTKAYLGAGGTRSVFTMFQFLFGSAVANVRRRVGMFDDQNGFYFEQAGDGTISFVRRTYTGGSVSESDRVAQSSWNLDKMDGTGVSGITLDLTKAQTLIIDEHWPLSRVRFGFRIGGIIRYAHTINSANNLTTSLTTNSRLPHRFEIASTAASAGATMKQFGSALYTEEGDLPDYRYYATGSVLAGVSCATPARVPILSIRPRTTFNGITNRGNIRILEIDVMAKDNPVKYELIYSGTLTGASWKNVDPSEHTFAEMDTTATVISGGIKIEQGYCSADSKTTGEAETDVIDRMPITMMDISGTQGIPVTLCATSCAGTALVWGTICWVEER